MIPIPKGKNNRNCTTSANYRPITLSSVLGKLFDRILLNRYADSLTTSHLQFGFKKRHSTAMCSMVLKETIEYYRSNRGTTYCVMLDATKAFDRVQYCKLFRKLIDRNLPLVIIRFLLNMYTMHQTHVECNGANSRWFNVRNGVKQGGVLSPVLFCVYIDGLLNAVSEAGVGCHMGHMFVGALAYADDIVLISPTVHGMRSMLNTCDEYAKDFDVVFNGSKSKCIVNRPRRKSAMCADECDVRFSVGGQNIELVDNWPHLGHVISKDGDSKSDIAQRRSKFIGQVNNVLCWFGKLDCSTKTRLLKSYCSDFYGCELWDLSDIAVQSLCTSWRCALRRVWKLPYNCHKFILHVLSGSMPLMDAFCKRFYNFVCTCINSENVIVKHVVRQGIFHSRMPSCVGRNMQFLRERYETMGHMFDVWQGMTGFFFQILEN